MLLHRAFELLGWSQSAYARWVAWYLGSLPGFQGRVGLRTSNRVCPRMGRASGAFGLFWFGLGVARRSAVCTILGAWGRAVYLYRLGGHMWHTVVRRVCFPASRARCGHWSSSLFASGGVVTVMQACFASSGRARCRCLGRCSWGSLVRGRGLRKQCRELVLQ